ncbi:hypothetical protein EDD85DRAFT_979812 [Armillaria nabsnona]|nr:hypothetical protein EDD85DRAFT_979812 [Armillaria nabsnona]
MAILIFRRGLRKGIREFVLRSADLDRRTLLSEDRCKWTSKNCVYGRIVLMVSKCRTSDGHEKLSGRSRASAVIQSLSSIVQNCARTLIVRIITIMSVFDPSENKLLHEKQTLASTSCSYPGLFSNRWQTKVILKCQEWGKELLLLQVGVKSIHPDELPRRQPRHGFRHLLYSSSLLNGDIPLDGNEQRIPKWRRFRKVIRGADDNVLLCFVPSLAEGRNLMACFNSSSRSQSFIETVLMCLPFMNHRTSNRRSQFGTSTPSCIEEYSTETTSLRAALKQPGKTTDGPGLSCPEETTIARRRNDAELALRHMHERYKSYKQHHTFLYHLSMGNYTSGRFSIGPGISKGVAECPGCEGRKRSLMESNVEHRECNSTLVIAWVSLALLLLTAAIIRVRRRCRKIADIESRAFQGTVKLPVEGEEDVKSQTMFEAVEDAPTA